MGRALEKTVGERGTSVEEGAKALLPGKRLLGSLKREFRCSSLDLRWGRGIQRCEQPAAVLRFERGRGIPLLLREQPAAVLNYH